MNINGEKLTKGDCCFVPAGLGSYAAEGEARFIFVSI
jgi:hypothetical protein